MDRRAFMEGTGANLAAFITAGKKLFKGDGGTASRTLAELSAIRGDFPPLERWSYLDTAFVGLMPRQVVAAHEAFLRERHNMGPYVSDKSILGIWLDRTNHVRKKLAAFLGAKDTEIAFTLCTACGMNIALSAIDWRKGDNVLIDDFAYPTDFHLVNRIKAKGVEVRIIKNEGGDVPAERFAARADNRTRAIVVSHVSYLNGFRHDLKALAGIVHSFGGTLIVDSAQSVGGIAVDVKKEDVDYLSGIAYKWLNGPTGVGFLYIREHLIPLTPPDRLGALAVDDFVSLETMESAPLPKTGRRFEYGTLAFESIYGLDAALDYIQAAGIRNIEERNLKLVDMIRRELKKRNLPVLTPEGNRSPILSFRVENERSLGKAMREKNVYVTARRWREGHVRLSPHFYNTEKDVEKFFSVWDELSKGK